MGWARGAYGGEMMHMQAFGRGNLRVRDNLGDSGEDEMIIISWILRKGGVGGGYGLDRAGYG